MLWPSDIEIWSSFPPSLFFPTDIALQSWSCGFDHLVLVRFWLPLLRYSIQYKHPHKKAVHGHNCCIQMCGTVNPPMADIATTPTNALQGAVTLTLTLSWRLYPKRPTTIHTHIHTRRRRQPCMLTASSLEVDRVRCRARVHLDTQLGGAGDRTSNLPV